MKNINIKAQNIKKGHVLDGGLIKITVMADARVEGDGEVRKVFIKTDRYGEVGANFNQDLLTVAPEEDAQN